MKVLEVNQTLGSRNCEKTQFYSRAIEIPSLEPATRSPPKSALPPYFHSNRPPPIPTLSPQMSNMMRSNPFQVGPGLLHAITSS